MSTITKEVIYGGLHHCALLVSDVEKSKQFYMEVLGFSDVSHLRNLPYPGFYFQVGRDQVHVMGLPNPDPIEGRPSHGGRDRHTAVNVNNIDNLRLRLESKSVEYTMSSSGRRAIFCRDYDGNAFEFMEDITL